MGVTVVTDCRVAAFARADGVTIYVLFEEAYEKNSTPTRPSWSARTLGTYDQVLSDVLATAAACEDGKRQAREGYVRPEAHLLRWERAFQVPVAMPDIELDLFIDDAWDAPLPRRDAPRVLRVLRAAGRCDIADALDKGPVRLRLHRDVDLLLLLYVDLGLGLWRVLDHDDVGPARLRRELAPPLREGAPVLPRLTAFALKGGHVVMRVGDGDFCHQGLWYQAMEAFITGTAYPSELKRSGAARDAITAFRAACDAAPPLPASAVVTVPWRVDDGACDAVEMLAGALGIRHPDQTDAAFTFEFGRVDAAALEMLLALPSGHAGWAVPVAAH